MPRLKIADHLSQLLGKLRKEHSELSARLEEINGIFSRLGITFGGVVTGARRGRPPKNASLAKASGGKRRRRRRGKFTMSGEQSIIEFVKKHGKPNAAEVNKHWSDEGRGGKADNALGRLVKIGTLKRSKTAGERGARYSIA